MSPAGIDPSSAVGVTNKVIEATPDVVSRISKMFPDMTDEQVTQVLTGFNAVREGDPLGRVCRNSETGEVAHRVDENGLHRWRISPPGGGAYNNDEPNLPGWDIVFDPPIEP